MKKKLLTSFFLLMGGITFSQTSSDNVGIGTITPLKKLHVLGSAKFDVAADTFIVAGTTPYMALFQRSAPWSGSGRTAAHFQWKNTSNDGLTDGSGVDVDFSLIDYPGVLRNLGTYSFKRKLNDSSSQFRLYTYKNAVRFLGLVMDENQNLGLGTLFPEKKLHVIGAARFEAAADTFIITANNDTRLEFNAATGLRVVENGNTVINTQNGKVNIGSNAAATSVLQVNGLFEYMDNQAAIAAGLTVGALYRTGDLLKVVH